LSVHFNAIPTPIFGLKKGEIGERQKFSRINAIDLRRHADAHRDFQGSGVANVNRG
jgi:hypothetical protein